MAYTFENLPQTVDKRGKLTESTRWAAPNRKTSLKNAERAIHHSLTKKDAAGSNPEGFARYHVNTLDWPCIGYAIVITPNETVDTPNGKRAKIHFNVNLDLVTYHVGNSNDVAIGICVAGDYRTETLDEPTMASYYELMEALDADEIAMNGSFKHSQYPGYSWKACSVYEPEYAYEHGKDAASGGEQNQVPVGDIPSVYTVQQGDTLYSIAQEDDRINVDDLIAWNDISDATALRVGQPLKLQDVNFSDETDDGWVYPDSGLPYREESAVFTNTCGENIICRYYPTTDSDIQGRVPNGDTFTYDRVYTYGGYVWISKVHDSDRIFLPIRTYSDGVNGEAWGNFS